MSITPKIIDLNGNKTLKLHMHVENPFGYQIKGSINFIINFLDGKREKISKEVKVPKKTKKDFFLTYNVKSSSKEGFHKVFAFFSYDNKKIDSSTEKNDFFLVVNTGKIHERGAKSFIKNLQKDWKKKK